MPDIPIGRRNKQELPRIKDRISFLYLEHCTVGRSDNYITATDEKGIITIPSASIGMLMLGPGTRVTHRAMELLGDSGCSVSWVGEKGIRFYAGGRPLTTSTCLLMIQAKKVSNIHTRLAVARKMYEMRFPGEDFSGMTMQQLRGREGTRVKRAYREAASQYGVEWNGRNYDPDDFGASDAVNQALSVANSCLYGIVESVITALGCSPGLGFIHVGHSRSFVYDISDLYKTELTIPIAFRAASTGSGMSSKAVRMAFREQIVGKNIHERIATDIMTLLSAEGETDSDGELYLWDDKEAAVDSGHMYTEGRCWSFP